jgi:RNA polymerase sigma factor (sigma-70 family)
MTAVERQDAIGQLFKDRYDDYIRMYKSRAGAQDVEDVVQEAFYRALYYKHTFNPALVPLEHWMSGILDNCLKDLLREKQNGSSMHDKLTEDSAIIEPRGDEGFTKILTQEIGKKSGDSKNALYLYFLCGYELREVHRVIGGSYNTIEVWTRRFKDMLRASYPEYREQDA